MEVLNQNFSDRSCAFRGKRTKRSRPSSPLYTAGTTAVATTSSSATAGGSDDGVGDGGGGDDFCNSTIHEYSSTTSTTQISTNSTSEEDEDMANCLILLAQSGCDGQKKEKIRSRKFAEMTTISTTGKAGFYLYECKTCKRTFPSFQALGGHRASHKKLKTTVEEKKSVTVNTTDTAATEQQQKQHQESDHDQGRLNKISTSHSNQTVINNNNNNNSTSKTKIHECSICGSVFSSGQALGGHMRRHRPPTTTTTTPTMTNTKISAIFETTTSNVSESSTSSHHHDEKSTRNILSLDLNLPAPQEQEDDHKIEQSIVFSAAPLVDCYY